MKTKFTLVLLVLALSVCKPNAVTAQVNVQDSLVLVALYNSTDGPNWKNHDNWLTSNPVKTWYGIYSSGDVLYGLYLSNNQLSGNIPPELGNIISLIQLDLSDNQLSGSIPPALGNLTNLLGLSLNNNQLSGSIPPELGNLKNLGRYSDHFLDFPLDLSNNQLSGNIPAALGKLRYLEYLCLDSNQLNGHIPSKLGKLTNLVVFSVKFNNLGGYIPSSLGNLSRLRQLILSRNKLNGNIPSSFANLKKLQRLRLWDNKLSGTVPSFLATLPNLQSLSFHHNHYTFDGLEVLVQNNSLDTFRYARQREIDIHQTNNILSVYAGGTLSNNTYKWFKDGALVSTITGDSTFTPTASGNYNVEVTNSIATELTLYSDTLNISAVTATQQNDIAAIKADDKKSFSVYPNPAKTIATVVFNETGNCIIKLTDISGRALQTKTIAAVKGGNMLQLDVSKYAAGMYLITLINNKDQSHILKLRKE